MSPFIKYLMFLTLLIIPSDGSRILGIFHIPSRSHHILASGLLKSLAERGHDVTMVSPFPFKKPVKNYREVFLDNMDQFKEENMRAMMKPNISTFEQMSIGLQIFDKMSEAVLSHKDVQALKNENFDLVIQVAMMSDALLGLAYHFKAPVIYFSTVGSFFTINQIFGNPAPPSYVPAMMVTMPSEMTFFQRVQNTISSFLGPLFLEFMVYKQEAVHRKYFPDSPPISELLKNVSLAFVNSHFSIESPRPHVPNIIQVGGIHIEEPKELPKDLKDYLDSAKDGVIFFSLGSNVRISDLPSEKVEALLTVLGKLQQKVLFKTDETFKNAPSNIEFRKWLPQNDILAHPNVQLFISHGGLLSTTEAVFHGVPILGIPMFGDQKFNVADAETNGYAVRLLIDDLTEETLHKALNEILTNSKYRDNIKLRSSLLRGQPIKPKDLAIHWVEHVLKHKGAIHLKNAGLKLKWYQYILIDVYLFIFVSISIVSFICYIVTKKILKFFFNICFGNRKEKQH